MDLLGLTSEDYEYIGRGVIVSCMIVGGLYIAAGIEILIREVTDIPPRPT